MKMTLTQSIIINKLSLDVKPNPGQQERVDDLPSPEWKAYLITDSHKWCQNQCCQKANGKALQESIRSLMSHVSDFASLDQAREAARKLVETHEADLTKCLSS
ncbi:hypothetical protein DUQ00_10255 [Salmonella bongori]|uniref:hypothetical protein n=1 Tax=Salmonella bongori TaxID=54736 RepID=UPI0009A9DF2D|nr:hypothetical protein [Salmonella bongori]EGE4653913.1 hypothetical protein [Salmonella bongori serovar 40:z35:- str. 95-0123]ECC8923463.1 hypothetical protein [Salmonella bongori]ECC9596702.1 hypothetical protein [Salmonella bongori]EDP8661027.1 hypothetical protein [Salmonella bongori]QVP38262.1 hypothetical protein AIT23_04440 [Salmonella bongori serovar 40:z35:-]